MELQFNIAAEKRVVEEISQLLISKDNVKTKPEKRSRSNTIKYDLSEKAKYKILPHYNTEIRKEILKDISIDELQNSNETLNQEVSNLLKEIFYFLPDSPICKYFLVLSCFGFYSVLKLLIGFLLAVFRVLKRTINSVKPRTEIPTIKNVHKLMLMLYS